jgi:hypothetical protein
MAAGPGVRTYFGLPPERWSQKIGGTRGRQLSARDRSGSRRGLDDGQDPPSVTLRRSQRSSSSPPSLTRSGDVAQPRSSSTRLEIPRTRIWRAAKGPSDVHGDVVAIGQLLRLRAEPFEPSGARPATACRRRPVAASARQRCGNIAPADQAVGSGVRGRIAGRPRAVEDDAPPVASSQVEDGGCATNTATASSVLPSRFARRPAPGTTGFLCQQQHRAVPVPAQIV